MDKLRRHCVPKNGKTKLLGYGEEASLVLDSGVWAKLPDSIVLSVLQFLAWEDVFRFRTVHKEWNLFLRSPYFKMAWQKHPDQKPICFASSAANNSYFNPVTGKWHLSGVDLPPSLCAAGSDLPRDVAKTDRSRRFPVVSAAKGFLLAQMFIDDQQCSDALRDAEITEARDVLDDFLLNYSLEDGSTAVDRLQHVVEGNGSILPDYNDGSTASDDLQEAIEMLLIVNPLEPLRTEFITAVPFLQDNYCQHEIIWDPKFRTYELLARSADISQYRVDGNCEWSIVFHRYDFIAGMWTEIVSWSTHRFISLESSCLIGGQLVCLGRPATLRSVNLKPYRIYGVELSKSLSIEEMELTAPILPFSLGFAILFYYEGMYMVAGGNVSAKYSTLKTFKVWRKQELSGDSEWTEVLQMPKPLVLGLNYRGIGSQYTCKVNGRFICIANRCTDIVMCDLQKESWWRLPPHPRGRDGASEGLALCDPRFDAALTW